MVRRRRILPQFVSLLMLAVFVGGTTATWAARQDPGLPDNFLTIEGVVVTLSFFGTPTQLTIKGVNFDFVNTLQVKLGPNSSNMNALDIVSSSGTEIVADIPVPSDYPPGDYLLTVSTGSGLSQNDEYDLTISKIKLPKANDSLRVDEASLEILDGQTSSIIPTCQVPNILLGGGSVGLGGIPIGMELTRNERFGTTQWICTWENNTGSTQTGKCYVLCLVNR